MQYLKPYKTHANFKERMQLLAISIAGLGDALLTLISLGYVTTHWRMGAVFYFDNGY